MRDRLRRTFLFVFPALIAVAFGVGMSRLSAQTTPVASGFERVANIEEVPRFLLVVKARDGYAITYHRTVEAAVQQLKSQSTSREDLVGLYEVGRQVNLTHKRTKKKAPDVITEGVETTYEEWSAQ